MFKINTRIVKQKALQIIEKYQDIEKFLPYCKECDNYHSKWSCPPLTFNPREYLEKYKNIYIISCQVNYDSETINSLQNSEEIATFSKRVLRKIKNQIGTNLLEIEKRYEKTMSISAGACSYCCKCSRKENQPCKKPEKMRYSLDSFGVDLTRISEDLFGIKILWGSDKLPDYHVLLLALLSDSDIPESEILEILNTQNMTTVEFTSHKSMKSK